jgi:hypothetical protein
MPPKDYAKIEVSIQEEEVCRLPGSVTVVLTTKILSAISEYFQEMEAKTEIPTCLRLVAVPSLETDDCGLPSSSFISVRANTAYPKKTITPASLPDKVNVCGAEIEIPWARHPCNAEAPPAVEKTDIITDTETADLYAECEEEEDDDEQPDDDYPEPPF